MKRLFLTAALSLCLAAPAYAAAVPKENSVVTTDQITLGDVFDGVTANAGHYLAPAPELGKTMTLGAYDLTRISNAFHLGWTPADGSARVVIRRASGMLDHYDVQAALEKRLKEETKGQKFDMELADRSISFRVSGGATRDVIIDRLSYDAVKGEFSAVVSAAAVPGVKKEVSGRIFPISQVPVLKTPLRPGDVISRDDVDYIDMHAADITPSMLTNADSLVGHSPRRGVSAMKPLMASDIQMPIVVKKGDLVTMVLKNKALNLTTQGRAMENGAEGDAIHVMNSSSKQVVDAVVTGALTVSIQPPQGNL